MTLEGDFSLQLFETRVKNKNQKQKTKKKKQLRKNSRHDPRPLKTHPDSKLDQIDAYKWVKERNTLNR